MLSALKNYFMNTFLAIFIGVSTCFVTGTVVGMTYASFLFKDRFEEKSSFIEYNNSIIWGYIIGYMIMLTMNALLFILKKYTKGKKIWFLSKPILNHENELTLVVIPIGFIVWMAWLTYDCCHSNGFGTELKGYDKFYYIISVIFICVFSLTMAVFSIRKYLGVSQ